VDGAITRHGTVNLAYVAPAARVSANAFALWPLEKSAGSAIAVTSGAVPGALRARTEPADAVTTTTENAAAVTATQRRTTTRSRGS
jgi:ABC-type uncharacterized transport system permease subunit